MTLLGSSKNSLTSVLWGALRKVGGAHEFMLADLDHVVGSQDGNPEMIYVYVPTPGDRDGMTPDLGEANRLFQGLRELQTRKLIVLSSALIYGTGPGRQALVDEEYSAPKNQDHRIWKSGLQICGIVRAW
jgi:hypothetical protein